MSIRKKISLFILTFTAIALSTGIPMYMQRSTKEISIDEAYTYPVVPGTKEWNELGADQYPEVCQIPQNILEHMTTDALIETIANYPLAFELCAYNDLATGYQALYDQFNGLQELQNRTDAYDRLQEALSDTETYDEMQLEYLKIVNENMEWA